MKHLMDRLDDGRTFHRFYTDKGNVCVLIHPRGDGSATLSVYEEEVAKVSEGVINEIAREFAQYKQARNHFGTGLMLRIMRAVVKSMPEVTKWVTDNREKARDNVGRKHVRTF